MQGGNHAVLQLPASCAGLRTVPHLLVTMLQLGN